MCWLLLEMLPWSGEGNVGMTVMPRKVSTVLGPRDQPKPEPTPKTDGKIVGEPLAETGPPVALSLCLSQGASVSYSPWELTSPSPVDTRRRLGLAEKEKPGRVEQALIFHRNAVESWGEPRSNRPSVRGSWPQGG